MTEKTPSWWRRECGPRDVLAIAMPLILSTASLSIMIFVDRMFLIWYSKDAMAAALPAGMVHWSLFCFPMGVASYVNTFVAQYHGAGRPERIGLAVGQGLRLGVYATPLCLLTVPLAPYIFRFVGHEPSLVNLETLYFQALAFGAGGWIISQAQAAFYTGRGITWVVMLVDIFTCTLNGVLDYLWIFGLGGFPELGIEGAAWATALSQWAKVAIYWALMRAPDLRYAYGLANLGRFDAALFRRLLYYGGPSGLHLLIEGSAFTLLILFMARLGKNATAATAVAFNINSIAFVPMIGLGMAVGTIVGQQLGRDRPDLAARATWTSLWMAFLYTAVFGALYVFAPEVFLWLHAVGADEGDWREIHGLSGILLRFVAAYCLFDATQIVFVSAIRGAGDTAFILATTVCTSLTALIVGQTGIVLFGLGLYWWWCVMTGWICSLGMIYLFRFLQGRWKHIRVIEPEFADAYPIEIDDAKKGAETVEAGT